MVEGDQTLGDENTLQCTDDVLWNYTPVTYTRLPQYIKLKINKTLFRILKIK